MERKFEDMHNSCHRCLGTGYRLLDLIARVIPVVEKSHNGSGRITCCIATDILENQDAGGEREQNDEAQISW